MPTVGDALQLVLAGVLEREPEPATRSFTVEDTSTSEGSASAIDPGADVDRDTANVLTDEFDLAGVDPGTDLEAERLDIARRSPGRSGRRAPVRRRSRASRRPVVSTYRPRCRSISPRTIASCDASSSVQRGVAEFGRLLGRPDDVGEQHGGEHAIVGHRRRCLARHERLDLVEHAMPCPRTRAASRPLGARRSARPGCIPR